MNFSLHSLWHTFISTFLRVVAGILGVGASLALLLIVLGVFFSAGQSAPMEEPSRFTVITRPDPTGSTELLPTHSPVVWQLPIRGMIGMHDLTAATIHRIELALEKMVEHRKLAGILLLMDSCGGTAYDSAQIYQMLIKLKDRHHIPIYAHVESTCCSGGVYIASAADHISGSPESIVGSVGVLLGPIFNVYNGLAQWGVEARTLAAGAQKDAGSPFRPWKENEFAEYTAMMEANYDSFVQVVAQNRPRLTAEALRSEIGARVFLGEEAQRIGFLDDAHGSRDATLAALLRAADVQQAQVIEFETTRHMLTELLEESHHMLQQTFMPWKPAWWDLRHRGPLWICTEVGGA